MSSYGWLLLPFCAVVYAQDPFEIVIFEYEPLPRGAYTYEAHVNYALHGPDTRAGWEFQPSGRIGWRATDKLTPSLEYYSSLGPLGNILPARQQIHLFFPGADWKIDERLTWSFGVGVGATDAASRVILKSRFEIEFGRKHD
jgi:hypothetical protein